MLKIRKKLTFEAIVQTIVLRVPMVGTRSQIVGTQIQIVGTRIQIVGTRIQIVGTRIQTVGIQKCPFFERRHFLDGVSGGYEKHAKRIGDTRSYFEARQKERKRPISVPLKTR